jgi:hypothetical protein
MHILLEIWYWLVANGLFKDLLAMFIGSLGFLLPWRHHRAAQKDIEDKLDTKTPGGLRDVLLMQKAQLKHQEEMKSGGVKDPGEKG